jgi:VanZ family protein
MQRVSQRVSRYLPLVLWMTIISLASTGEFSGENTSRIIRPIVLWLFPGTTEGTLQVIHFTVRKMAHFGEYAVMAFLAARAFTTSSKELLRRRWALVTFVLIVAYASLDEYHQSFVPNRTASIYDSMIDAVGGCAGLFLYDRRRKRRLNSPST